MIPFKRLVFFGFIIVSLVVINNLAHSIYDLWHKKDLIVKAKQELAREKKENDELRKKLKIAQDPQFVEKEARDRLFLAKPGENVVVIPSGVLAARSSSDGQVSPKQANWQKWWKLFF